MILNQDFIRIANLLESYIFDKLPLGREFEDTVTSIRSLLHIENFPSGEQFAAEIADRKPSLVSRLDRVSPNKSSASYLHEIFALFTTQTDINELIPSIDDLGINDQPRDIIKSMIAGISTFEKRTLRVQSERSKSEDTAEKRYLDFLSAVQNRLSGAEVREVIAWLSIAASHQKFNARRNLVFDHDGEIDIQKTVLNLMQFANMVAISDKPVFQTIEDRKVGGRVKFSLQKGGTPDLMYVEGGSVKVGFASNSRCTKIEGNSFFRHTLEVGFINSCLSLLGASQNGTLGELKESISDVVGKFKCRTDYSNIGNSNKRWNDEQDVVENTRKLLANLVESRKLNPQIAHHILEKGSIFLKGNQATRCLFFTRLNAYINKQLMVEDIFEPIVCERDIEFIHPKEMREISYFTTSPDKRLSKFLEGVLEAVNPKCTKDLELLSIIKNGDENKLFRGLCRTAFIGAHGNVSGSLLVSHEAQSALLNKMSFVSDTRDINVEKELSRAVLALMFTSDQSLWAAISQELSDVSHYKTGMFGKTSYTRGIFCEERENLIESIRVIVDICNKELRLGRDIQPVLNQYFGEHSEYVGTQIANGVLLEMSNRFNCEDIGFTSSGIKTSLSENNDPMQRLSDSLDLLHSRCDGLDNKAMKDQIKHKFR